MKRRKLKEDRKDEDIRVRVTLAQKQSFTDVAQREGLEVSSWLRSLGVKAAAQKAVGEPSKEGQ